MRLPQFLEQLSPIGETLRAIDRGTDALRAEVDRSNRQLAVSTADTGLTSWEADYGLPDGSGKSDESRRLRLCSVMLGGQTLTRAVLEELARTLSGVQQVETNEDFTGHRVTVSLYCGGAVPPDLTALRDALERRKPAHLAVEVCPVMDLRGTMRPYHTLTGRAYLTLSGQRET